ncbi:PREDICTED: heat shock transcription factor, Y-linked-like [Elephantulus edwardii]|uniref:heat shock transcription factor, Y-linked-like n=1 Tax=Elephantulus edwardii TaxID=28737 RepID=UPI0003F0E011|nr:PREDICTED: heat shock transcription factor, Y-linked-like [Elephantulus edwardii]
MHSQNKCLHPGLLHVATLWDSLGHKIAPRPPMILVTLSKLLFYHNPNFKCGCPHLLLKMKRRVGIKSLSLVHPSLVPDFHKNRFQARSYADNQSTGLVPKSRGVCFFSPPTELNTTLTGKHSASQILDNTSAPVRNLLSPSTFTSTRLTERVVTDQHVTLDHLVKFQMYSQNKYKYAKDAVINSVTITNSFQYKVISSLEKHYLEPMNPSVFPKQNPELSANENLFSNQLTSKQFVNPSTPDG